MKKLAVLFLTLALVLPLFASCGGTELAMEETATVAATVAATATEESEILQTKPEETKPEVLPADNLKQKLSREQVEALPVANESMTYEQRRQLALDYFDLQLSFQWIPNLDVKDYPTTYSNGEKEILQKYYYRGVPYQSTGTGNLYRWLEYYDEESAVMDLARAFEENGGYGEGAVITDLQEKNGSVYKKYRSLMTMFNQCSVASFWGWGRVINSACFGWTYDMTVSNGFIPVGLYTYPNMTTLEQLGEKSATNPDKYDTPDVIRDWNAQNGADAMYKCYAQMKPADLVVSTGHTMMIESVVLKYNEDGTVNYEKSYATVQEQTEGWDTDKYINGKKMVTQGRNGKQYTFKTLQSKKYIPFTFAEFLDPNDPQDKKHLDFYNSVIVPLNHWSRGYENFTFTAAELAEMTGGGVEKARIFTTAPEGADSITYADFEAFAVGSNYSVSDVFVTVTDENGKVMKENVYRALSARTREVTMQFQHSSGKEGMTLLEGIKEFADGKHTVTVTVQLSNGEKPTAFSGTLLP